MIRLTDLNTDTRECLNVLEPYQVYVILQWATELMDEVSMRRGWARLGANGAVVLACALVIFLDKSYNQNSMPRLSGHGKGNCNE